MGGGLIQLVAMGAQDIYITGNPQITFFKIVYRRHTSFSIETIEQTVEGDSKIHGGNGFFKILRNGDLVSNVFMVFKNTNTTNDYYNDHLGNYILNGANINLEPAIFNQLNSAILIIGTLALSLYIDFRFLYTIQLLYDSKTFSPKPKYKVTYINAKRFLLNNIAQISIGI